MTIKIGELRGELVSVKTTKKKDASRVTCALVEVLANIDYGEGEIISRVVVSVPIDLDRYGELVEHVGRQVRISFEVKD